MKTIKALVIFFVLSSIYFFTRFFHLTSLPIFADESIYIRWAQVMKSVETLRFLPLTDGKQPLFMWLIIPFLKLINNPLISGRAVSIFSGFVSFISLWVLSGIFDYQKKIPENPVHFLIKTLSRNLKLKVLISILYLSNPYTYFFNRLATADDLLTAFFLVAVNLAILQTIYLRFDLSLLLGGTLGLAWLTKSPAIVFFVLIFIYQFVFSKDKIKSVFLSVFSGILMLIIYNILRLGPQYHMIAIRNQDYVWSLSEILRHPLDPLKPHLISYLGLLWQYMGPIIILVPFGFLLNNRKSRFIFALFFLLPALAVLSTTKVLTARYLLFTLPFFLFFLAQVLFVISKKSQLFFFVSILVAASFCLKNTVWIAVNPYAYQFPTSESGYINDWTSGWGIEKVANYAKDKAKNGQNVILAAEGNFGNPKDGLQIYLNGQDKVTVISQEPLLYQISQNLDKARDAGDLVLIVHNSQRFYINDPIQLAKLNLISSYEKPDHTKLLLFSLK